MAGFTELFDYSARQNKKIDKLLKEIKEKQKLYENVSLEEFKELTEKLKDRLKNGETLDDILVDAYAIICEAFKKLQKKKYPNDETRNGYYDEQIKTSLVLSNGDLAQMLTGEGKTYALTLSAYLNALKGEGMHIITANEYLAQRDYEDNKELFETVGLTASFVGNEDTHEQKRKAYACDITYATPTTIAFDYLRDNMVIHKEDKVMRGLSSCILDEVDASLIDEANNPFIISEADKVPKEFYKDVKEIIEKLRGKVVDASLDQTYQNVNEMEKDTAYLDFIGSKQDFNIFLTDVGIERVNRRLKELGYEDQIEKINGREVIIEPQNYMASFIKNALVANYLMKDKNDYLVQENKIKVINKETGRIAVGSSFGKGLHQAIEAKENVEISEGNITLNSINQPNLFKLYNHFSGLSGTLISSKKELKEIYHKDIVVISPRKGMNRIDERDVVCQTQKEKDNEILKEVQKAKEKGQPVLIGTESIEESERVSKFLQENNIENQLLNASNPTKEAEIISEAGKVGKITVTTNIAGRGTDIKVSEEALKVGGLYIIGSSLSESKRIDDQLRGRSGRQGNIGKSKFIISLEDSIFGKHYIPSKLKKLKDFLKTKAPKELQTAVRKIQQKIELDSFIAHQKRNEIESVDAFFREHFDAEKDKIRNAENIESIFISLLDAKLKEDIKKGTILDKYQTWSEEKNPKKLAQIIKEKVESKLKIEKEKLGDKVFSSKLKESMLNASKETWIKFINNADNRQMQAQMNSTYKQTAMSDEYLSVSYKEWEEEMHHLQSQIIRNVTEDFEKKKEIEKEEEVKTPINKKEKPKVPEKKEESIEEKKIFTHDEILDKVAIMLFYKDDPQKVIEMERLWKENRNSFSTMDKQLVESSIKVGKKIYVKRLKEQIMHAETKEEVENLESKICYEILKEEEIQIINSLLEEVKRNTNNTSIRPNIL